MSRTLLDSRRWVQQGTKLLADTLAGLDEASFTAPSALPGWSRKHLVAHVAANGEAIGNLVHWAATGERTPMYASPEQRDADIEAGSLLSGSQLAEWFERSAMRLDSAMEALPARQWAAEVVTAQGRTVPASETPWMRAREVMVHNADLATGITFRELPADFLLALCDDISAKRSGAASGPALIVEATDTRRRWDVAGAGEPVLVTAPIAAITAYLAGRGPHGVSAPGARDVPALPAWL